MHHHSLLVALLLLVLILLVLLPWQFSLPASALLAMAGVAVELEVIRAQRRPVVTGEQAMIGDRAIVRSGAGTEVEVAYRGELWRAVSDEPLKPGETVIIQCINGLTLWVTPAGLPNSDVPAAMPGVREH